MLERDRLAPFFPAVLSLDHISEETVKLVKASVLCTGFVLTLFFSAAPVSANIVVNPGFETGDFTGWTANPSSSFPWAVTSGNPHSGTYDASTGCVGAQCVDQTNLSTAAYLYQNLVTAPGSTYSLSFYFEGAGTPEELKVLWGGNVVLDLCPGASNSCTDINNTAYQQYSVSGLVATSASTQLMFLARQDPGFDHLDDVDVELGSSTAAPEPASLALLGFGLLTVPLYRKLRNRR